MTDRTPASPVSGRLAFSNDEMRCNQCDKQTPHRLFGDTWRCSECGGASSICAQPASGPVSGEAVAELDKLLEELEDATMEGALDLRNAPPKERERIEDRYHAARAALVAIYAKQREEISDLARGLDGLSSQLERLKADSEQRIKALEHMIELRDRVIDKQREDFEWLESEGIDVLTRNRDGHGIEDDRIVLWGDTAAENQIFSSLREAIDVGRRLSQSSESPK